MCHYFLEKTSTKVREKRFFQYYLSQNFNYYRSAERCSVERFRWNVTSKKKILDLFNCPFQYVSNYDTPCWLKPFLFILKFDKYHKFTCLYSIDPQKEVQTREGFFLSFLCQRLQFLRFEKKEIYTIFIKLREVV